MQQCFLSIFCYFTITAAAKAAWERASATPAERLIRQLAGARADKLAAAADSAKAVAMRIGSDISSPPLPIRLKRSEPDAHGDPQSQVAHMDSSGRVELVNVSRFLCECLDVSLRMYEANVDLEVMIAGAKGGALIQCSQGKRATLPRQRA